MGVAGRRLGKCGVSLPPTSTLHPPLIFLRKSILALIFIIPSANDCQLARNFLRNNVLMGECLLFPAQGGVSTYMHFSGVACLLDNAWSSVWRAGRGGRACLCEGTGVAAASRHPALPYPFSSPFSSHSKALPSLPLPPTYNPLLSSLLFSPLSPFLSSILRLLLLSAATTRSYHVELRKHGSCYSFTLHYSRDFLAYLTLSAFRRESARHAASGEHGASDSPYFPSLHELIYLGSLPLLSL